MSLKSLGVAGVVLAVVLFALAAAQPATVTDSTRTCVDSTYYQDCSTVSYERPNTDRAQLFGAAGFLFFAGLVTYGIGAGRSSNGDRSADAAQPDAGGSTTTAPQRDTDGHSQTLREQLEARQSDGDDERTAGTSGDAPVRDSEPAFDARDAASADSEDGAASATASGVDAAEEGRIPPAVSVTASGLASAFVLSWLLGAATTVGNTGLRSFVFALCAVPGILLYRRYVATDGDVGVPTEVSE